MDEIRMQAGMLPIAADLETEQSTALMELPVNKERLLKFDSILNKYRSGKVRLESRVKASENWWKLRNDQEEEKEAAVGGDENFRAKTGWLHNVIVSKHADAMENYPEPIILPREPNDRQLAKTLSAVLPVILERNKFEKCYSDNMYQKLKTGTAVYQITWDGSLLNGLGDISIQRVDLLSLFWEPGVEDIQNSPYFFHCEMRDNEQLEAEFPQLKDRLKGSKQTIARFKTDDMVETADKSTVVDVYYKVKAGGRTVLHYCQYVNDVVLVSTENEGREHYRHGKYPFVFDALWPIEGSPAGYGYVDLCKNPQTQIDLMDTAFTKNAMVGATPRYFQRVDGAIKEEEFLDLTKPIVHVTGSVLDETQIRLIEWKPLAGTLINVYNNKIQELRETSGNTETATGSTSGGVTAASAIAALQEASGKTSRDSTQGSYRAFGDMIDQCIELIREFYSLPRTFLITGEQGQQEFATISNEAMNPHMVSMGDTQMGMVEPLFDIKVKVQKRNAYTRAAQNELALQLYGLGFFNPQLVDQAIVCLSMMDFEGKEDVLQKIALNGTLLQKLMQAQQLVLTLLQDYDPESVEPMAQAMGMDMNMEQAPAAGGGMPAGGLQQESGVTAKAKERTARTTEVSR